MPLGPEHLSRCMFANVRVSHFPLKASVVGGMEHYFGAIDGDFPTFDAQIRCRTADILSDTVRCP